MTDKPYTERLGGSYARGKDETEARLVERTAEAAPRTPATPKPAQDEASPDPARKPSAKRSD